MYLNASAEVGHTRIYVNKNTDLGGFSPTVGDSITISKCCCESASDHGTFVITGAAPSTPAISFDIPALTMDFSEYDRVTKTCSSTDGVGYPSFFPCGCGSEICGESTKCDITGAGGCGTCIPTTLPTPAPTVSAKGDPHLVNLNGEHFDVNHGGEFVLLRIPQDTARPAEVELKATIAPEHGKPCTTYITRAEISGAWLGGKSVEIRCYRKSHSNDTDAFLGARLLDGTGDSPWVTIEEFETKDLVLSDSESDIEVSLDKATWFPKKRSKAGPTAAGMFTLSLRNKKSPIGAKITMRQDLPEQEHLNVAVRQLSQLGRVDVGGLLGFDAHPESLERPSAACVHHRATARYRIESQDDADHGYYFRPAWKDRWDKARTGRSSRDNEAAASLMGRFDGQSGLDNMMCKCPSNPHGDATGSIEGVLVEEASFMFGKASWD